MRVGPYEIGSEVGRGGFGIVFRGRDARDGRTVAIKLLARTDGEAAQRFQREARLLASLGEVEGFVPLLDAGVESGSAFFVMPFLEGGTLGQRLRGGPPPLEEALALVARIARAVGRAHAMGIVHRDLKPDNVLFAPDGRAFVADLGLAKHFRRDVLGASQSVQLSRANELRGSMGYMAPEQITDAASADARADVFALGALLHECVTGAPAFQGSSLLEIVGAIESGARRPIHELRAGVPAWVDAIAARALARERDDRFADGEAVARAIEQRGAGARPRGSRVPLVAGLALVVCGGAVGLGLATRTPGPAPALPPRVASAPPPRTPPPDAAVPRLPANAPPSLAPLARTRAHVLAAVAGGYGCKHGAMAHSVAVTPDGKRLVSTGIDGTVHLWDERTGEHLAYLGRHEGEAYLIVVSGDGARAFSAGADGMLRTWDLAAGHAGPAVRVSDVRVTAVSLVRGDATVLVGGDDGVVTEVDAAAGTILRRSEKFAGSVEALARLDDRSVLATFSDGKLRLLEELRVVRETSCGEGGVWKLTVNGGIALAGGDDDAVHVIELPSLRRLRTLPRLHAGRGEAGRLGALVLSPDGRTFLAAGWDPLVRVRDVETGEVLRSMAGHRSFVTGAAFTPDGRRAHTAGNDQCVRAWDIETGQEARPVEGHEGRIFSVATSPDGSRLATAGWDQTVRLWDARTGRALGTLGQHEEPAFGVAFSPDGTVVASSGEDGKLRLWDAAAGSPLAVLDSPPAFALGFLDRARIAALGNEHALLLDADATTAKVLASKAVALATSNGRVVTVDSSGEVVLHRAAHGMATRIRRAAHPDARVVAVALGEAKVVTVTAAGTIEATNFAGATISSRRSAPCTSAAIDPDLERVVLIDGSRVRVVDVSTGNEIDAIDLASTGDVVQAVRATRDGFVLATARGVVLRFERLERVDKR